MNTGRPRTFPRPRPHPLPRPRPPPIFIPILSLILNITTILPRKSLGVSNIISSLEGRTPTVVGWGFTSGFDPWSGDPQVQSERKTGLTSSLLVKDLLVKC